MENKDYKKNSVDEALDVEDDKIKGAADESKSISFDVKNESNDSFDGNKADVSEHNDSGGVIIRDNALGSMRLFRGIVRLIKKNVYLLGLLALVFVLFILPLAIARVPIGHDYGFHFDRIYSLAEEMQKGNFFPRIYSGTFKGNGYASPMFYGDMFLHFPAYLIIKGVQTDVAYKCYIMLTAVVLALVSYFSFKSITKSKRGAFVGAVLFALSSYFITDCFFRSAVGELQAFVWIPLAYCGYHNIMFRSGKKWFLLPLGLFCMIQSHILTAVMFVIALIFMSLVSVTSFIKKPVKLLYMCLSAVVFFLMSAYFIFPMLEQILSSSFVLNNGSAATHWGSLASRSMNFWTLFSDFNTDFDIHPWIPNGIGLIFPLCIVLALTFRKKIKGTTHLLYIVLSGIILFMSSSLFPWDIFQSFCGILQFPWRLLTFATFFLAVGAAYLSKNASKNIVSTVTILMVGVSLFSAVACVDYKYTETIEDMTNKKTYNYKWEDNIVLGEYLPTGTNTSKLKSLSNKLTTNNSNLKLDGLTRTDDGLYFSYSGNENVGDTYAEVPLLMYLGYSAVDENGAELPVTAGDNNRVRVRLNNESGRVFVSYTGTSLQKLCDIISILTFVIGTLIIIFFKARKVLIKKQKQ